jgi:PKD repeat protein
VAALYLSANPSATAAQVASALASNATPNAIMGQPANTVNKLLNVQFIGGSATTNQPPVARFTWTCVGMTYPHQCAFDGSTSTDDNGVVTWKWTWGNGTGETKTVPATKKTFAAAGTYTVTLTVTDASGLTNSASQVVTVP